MRLPSPGLHCLRCDVPSVRRGVQHLADVGDVRQGSFTRCRWCSRFWAVFGVRHTSRPIFGGPGRQMSPYDLPIGGIRPQKRASPRRRSRPRHCARCRFGCVPATRRVLPGDAAAAAAARRPARPFAGLPGHCSGKAASSPTAMPNRRCLRARGTYVLLYIYVLYVLPCSAAMRRACPVCCGTSVLPAELPDNGSGSAALVRLRRRRRGKSSSS